MTSSCLGPFFVKVQVNYNHYLCVCKFMSESFNLIFIESKVSFIQYIFNSCPTFICQILPTSSHFQLKAFFLLFLCLPFWILFIINLFTYHILPNIFFPFLPVLSQRSFLIFPISFSYEKGKIYFWVSAPPSPRHMNALENYTHLLHCSHTRHPIMGKRYTGSQNIQGQTLIQFWGNLHEE